MATGKKYEIEFKLAAKLESSYHSAMNKAETDLNKLEHQFRAIEALRLSGDMVQPLRDGLRRLEPELKEIKNANGPKDFFQKIIIELREVLPQLRETKRLMTDISRIRQPTQRFGNDAERYVRQLREMEQRMRAIQQQGGPSGGGGGGDDSGGGGGGVGGLLVAGGTAAMAGVAAVGAAGFFALKGANEYQQAMNQIQSSTGTTTKQMESIKIAAQGVYNSGLGEGWDEVAQVMSKVRQVTQQTGDELQSTTSNAIALQGTFENLDVESSLKAAQTAARRFGISTDEAYNLFAQGAQKGLDYSGELLDSSNEYTTYFQKLGFDADQMFDVFAAGAETGAFNLDKVGKKALPTINRGIKRGSCNANPNRRRTNVLSISRVETA